MAVLSPAWTPGRFGNTLLRVGIGAEDHVGPDLGLRPVALTCQRVGPAPRVVGGVRRIPLGDHDRGHAIADENPGLAVELTAEVIAAVRDPGSWATPTASPTG